MKKYFIITLFALSGLLLLEAAEQRGISSGGKATRLLVPSGKTYVKIRNGKEIDRFRAGETMTARTDCVKVKCPGTFGPNIECWECHEDTTSPAPSPKADMRGDRETSGAGTRLPTKGVAGANVTTGPAGAKTSTVVPTGKTYVVLNDQKREVRRYRAGQNVAAADQVCWTIPCPAEFPGDFVCWHCKDKSPADKALPAREIKQ